MGAVQLPNVAAVHRRANAFLAIQAVASLEVGPLTSSSAPVLPPSSPAAHVERGNRVIRAFSRHASVERSGKIISMPYVQLLQCCRRRGDRSSQVSRAKT